MKQKIKSTLRTQVKQVPLFLNWWNYWKYQVEKDLIAGHHHNQNSHPSIIHFSVNKAATQYVKNILRQCAEENGMVHARIHDYAFDSNFPFLNQLTAQQMQQYQHIFQPQGYLYSVFGGMIEGITNLDDYYVILMVRDPRDVLTSGYYSIAYSHPTPHGQNKIESFTEKKYFARSVEIDEYVLAENDEVYQTYQRYLDLLVHQTNVHVTKYEDMIANFSLWLDKLLDYYQLEISSQLKQKLYQRANQSRQAKENKSQHMRQVTPGNYRNKLKPDTIAQLNSKFYNILEELGYTVNSNK